MQVKRERAIKFVIELTLEEARDFHESVGDDQPEIVLALARLINQVHYSQTGENIWEAE